MAIKLAKKIMQYNNFCEAMHNYLRNKTTIKSLQFPHIARLLRTNLQQ